MELNLDQLRRLQTRSDVVYITLNREITLPASKIHKQTYSKIIKEMIEVGKEKRNNLKKLQLCS